MRKKKRELVASGMGTNDIQIDWNKKTITTTDMHFVIKDGSIISPGACHSLNKRTGGHQDQSHSHSGPKAFDERVSDHHQRLISDNHDGMPNLSANETSFQSTSRPYRRKVSKKKSIGSVDMDLSEKST